MGRVFAALKYIVENRRIVCANIFGADFDRRLGFQYLGDLPYNPASFSDARALLGLHSYAKIGCVGVWKQAEAQDRHEKKRGECADQRTPDRAARPV